MKSRLKIITATLTLLGLLAGCGTLECGSRDVLNREIEHGHLGRDVR
jgi:hypothetical protein